MLTGGYSMTYLSLPMITVFKNLGSCLGVVGDAVFFNASISTKIKICMFLMVFGSVMAAITDLSFNFLGYFWTLLHVVL
jgi:hypothetical protein